MALKTLLTTSEAAPLIGVNAKTLENWRCSGAGPKFIRAGRLIRYDPDDIKEWRDRHRVSSTSAYLANQSESVG